MCSLTVLDISVPSSTGRLTDWPTDRVTDSDRQTDQKRDLVLTGGVPVVP